MGADIHLVLEKRDREQACWVGLHNFPWLQCGKDQPLIAHSRNMPEGGQPWLLQWRARQRNYKLFGLLANVRGAGPNPKGLPDDASTLTLMHLKDDADLHSHTWYSLEDAALRWIAAEHDYDVDGDPNEGLVTAVKLKFTNEHWLEAAATKFFGVDLDGYNKAEDYRVCIAFDN